MWKERKRMVQKQKGQEGWVKEEDKEEVFNLSCFFSPDVILYVHVN